MMRSSTASLKERQKFENVLFFFNQSQTFTSTLRMKAVEETGWWPECESTMSRTARRVWPGSCPDMQGWLGVWRRWGGGCGRSALQWQLEENQLCGGRPQQEATFVGWLPAETPTRLGLCFYRRLTLKERIFCNTVPPSMFDMLQMTAVRLLEMLHFLHQSVDLKTTRWFASALTQRRTCLGCWCLKLISELISTSTKVKKDCCNFEKSWRAEKLNSDRRENKKWIKLDKNDVYRWFTFKTTSPRGMRTFIDLHVSGRLWCQTEQQVYTKIRKRRASKVHLLWAINNLNAPQSKNKSKEKSP